MWVLQVELGALEQQPMLLNTEPATLAFFFFNVSYGELNSGYHTCKGSILPTEPSSKSSVFVACCQGPHHSMGSQR